jgi:hypothetical protein
MIELNLIASPGWGWWWFSWRLTGLRGAVRRRTAGHTDQRGRHVINK